MTKARNVEKLVFLLDDTFKIDLNALRNCKDVIKTFLFSSPLIALQI